MPSTIEYACDVRTGDCIYQRGDGYRRVHHATAVSGGETVFLTLDDGRVLQLHMRTFVSVVR